MNDGEQTGGSSATAAQGLMRRLADHGVRKVFGVVGREAASIAFDEVPEIEFILTRHEFTAAVMAETYARLTGRPQVCFGTVGPGVTNLSTGAATALLDRSPVLVLAAQVESTDLFYGDTHQCIDSVSVMRPLTKYADELHAPHHIAGLIDRAMTTIVQEPPGPAFLSLPIDVLAQSSERISVDERPVQTSATHTIQTDWPALVKDIVSRFERAEHPVFVVGSAVIRAGAVGLVRAVAERLGIPVISAYTAKGIMPAGHPLDYGAITGWHMNHILDYPALETVFDPADLVIALGYDYAENILPSMWNRGTTAEFVRVSPSINTVPRWVQPDVDVVANIADVVREFDRLTDTSSPKIPYDIAGYRESLRRLTEDHDVDGATLRVPQVLHCLNEFTKGATVVSDIGYFRHYCVLLVESEEPYDFLTSAGCSSFGYGLPAAMAAKMATPDRRVFLVAGDGGFHSNSQDLETAARLGLPLVILVLNDSRNGLIEHFQQLGHGRAHKPAVEFSDVDFALLAQANGCEGTTVASVDELRAALTKGLEIDRPYVIDVPISYADLDTASLDALRD